MYHRRLQQPHHHHQKQQQQQHEYDFKFTSEINNQPTLLLPTASGSKAKDYGDLVFSNIGGSFVAQSNLEEVTAERAGAEEGPGGASKDEVNCVHLMISCCIFWSLCIGLVITGLVVGILLTVDSVTVFTEMDALNLQMSSRLLQATDQSNKNSRSSYLTISDRSLIPLLPPTLTNKGDRGYRFQVAFKGTVFIRTRSLIGLSFNVDRLVLFYSPSAARQTNEQNDQQSKKRLLSKHVEKEKEEEVQYMNEAAEGENTADHYDGYGGDDGINQLSNLSSSPSNVDLDEKMSFRKLQTDEDVNTLFMRYWIFGALDKEQATFDSIYIPPTSVVSSTVFVDVDVELNQTTVKEFERQMNEDCVKFKRIRIGVLFKDYSVTVGKLLVLSIKNSKGLQLVGCRYSVACSSLVISNN